MHLKDSELSKDEKRGRALYSFLREELHQYLGELALEDSYANFLKAKQLYPFVEKRELKPRAKVSERENTLVNSFIVIFTEGALPPSMKSSIRHFDDNKTTKENLGELNLTGLNVADKFRTQQKYFETNKFYDLIKALLPIDYAILIQRDTSVKNKNRYALSHFHVRIDWMIDSAAEALGKELRYISKDLYEKGEGYAMNMVEKLFEHYSFHHSVAGRRTAAMLAAQLLSPLPHYSSVFVSSAESRTLTMISETGVSKSALIQLDKSQIEWIEKHANGDPDFREKYLVRSTKTGGVAKLQVIYGKNEHSKPPKSGKIRILKPDVQWLRISNQLLIPKSQYSGARPIKYETIYDQQDPLT